MSTPTYIETPGYRLAYLPTVHHQPIIVREVVCTADQTWELNLQPEHGGLPMRELKEPNFFFHCSRFLRCTFFTARVILVALTGS